jgi:triphosphoribosyl-dephospho-CoA synthase
LRGLDCVHRSAAGVLRSGGCATAAGHRRLERFCRQTRRRGLSMGGSADLLAATLFLDAVMPAEGG